MPTTRSVAESYPWSDPPDLTVSVIAVTWEDQPWRWVILTQDEEIREWISPDGASLADAETGGWYGDKSPSHWVPLALTQRTSPDGTNPG